MFNVHGIVKLQNFCDLDKSGGPKGRTFDLSHRGYFRAVISGFFVHRFYVDVKTFPKNSSQWSQKIVKWQPFLCIWHVSFKTTMSQIK